MSEEKKDEEKKDEEKKGEDSKSEDNKSEEKKNEEKKVKEVKSEEIMDEAKGFIGSLFDFSFSQFITTKIIKLVYILSIIGAGLGALSMIVGGFASKNVVSIIISIVLAPIVFFVYIIVARIWLELVLVIFKIADDTGKIAAGKKGDS